MLAFIVRRLVQAILVMLTVAFVAFLLLAARGMAALERRFRHLRPQR